MTLLPLSQPSLSDGHRILIAMTAPFASASATPPGRYEPRDPTQTVLYQVFQGHLETFLEAAQDPVSGTSVPRFVERELRKFLECGVLAHGFARVRCRDCGHSVVVGFSCKGRGFCSSCCGRRMASTAAHLVDRVLPRVPLRHWVLTLPIPIRHLIVYRPQLVNLVLSKFIDTLFEWIRERTGQDVEPKTGCGSVTLIQRFGSTLRLNIHFHTLALDGLFSCAAREPKPVFQPIPEPTSDEIAAIEERLARSIFALLVQEGHLMEGEIVLGEGEEPQAGEGLLRLQQASIAGWIALGRRAGSRVETEGTDPFLASLDRKYGALRSGFTLFAGERIDAADRERLERICRYLARPPIPEDRLSWTSDGKVRLELSRPLDDGTRAVLFEPIELIEKASALIPPPRANLTRYHGILAPNAAWRADVVPAPRAIHPSGTSGLSSRSRWIPWAELLRRVFERAWNCARYSGCAAAAPGDPSVSSVVWTDLCPGRSASSPPWRSSVVRSL